MARKKKSTNAIDERAVPFIKSALELLAEEASAKGARMNDAKRIRNAIADVLSAAKDEIGLPKGSFKAHLSIHALETKIDKRKSDMDIDERIAFDQLRDALGELGAAAADKAGHETRQKGGTDTPAPPEPPSPPAPVNGGAQAEADTHVPDENQSMEPGRTGPVAVAEREPESEHDAKPA